MRAWWPVSPGSGRAASTVEGKPALAPPLRAFLESSACLVSSPAQQPRPSSWPSQALAAVKAGFVTLRQFPPRAGLPPCSASGFFPLWFPLGTLAPGWGPPRPELLLKPPPSRAPSLPPPHFKVTGTHHWGRGEVAGVLLLVRKPGPQVPGRPPPRASDLCAGLSAVARGCPAEDPHLPPAASPPLRLPTQ